jgi:hypothetical protein
VSAELAAAMRLLDARQGAGVQLPNALPSGRTVRCSACGKASIYRDTVYLAGFSERCHARSRRNLIVPGGLPVIDRVDGDALTVLHTAVSDWGRLRSPTRETPSPLGKCVTNVIDEEFPRRYECAQHQEARNLVPVVVPFVAVAYFLHSFWIKLMHIEPEQIPVTRK